MLRSIRAAFAATLLLCLSLGIALPASAQAWQCVTFARAVSGIQIRGDAHTWWGQAAGRYERGGKPVVGAVMVLPGYGKMRVGHVAMVSKLVDARTIRITHANWSRRGQVETDVSVIDVSDNNDWSRVRVWWGPMNGLGLTSYPVSGFIYGGKAPLDSSPLIFASKDVPARDIDPVIDADEGQQIVKLQLASAGGN